MRDTQAIINLKHLEDNVKALSKHISKDSKFCGVVKANAYGHGAVEVAKRLQATGVDFLAVALAQEAIELRHAGIDLPILVLTPVTNEEELKQVIQNKIRITCFRPDHARVINRLAQALNTKAYVHLKVDSGMSRIGVQNADQGQAVLEELEDRNCLVEGIYTHFADADNMDEEDFTRQQFDHFQTVFQTLEDQGHHFAIKHACNSAATLRFPEYHLDMVRVGICLYGYPPAPDMAGLVDLKPLMTVKTKLAHVKPLEKGRYIGYNRTYQMDQDGKIGTLVIGYADGVFRSLSNKGYFLYQGQKLPIVGRVCMDQLMVDLSQVPDIEVGDEVTWFSPESQDTYSLFEIGDQAVSSHYEILTRISPRIPRIYQG